MNALTNDECAGFLLNSSWRWPQKPLYPQLSVRSLTHFSLPAIIHLRDLPPHFALKRSLQQPMTMTTDVHLSPALARELSPTTAADLDAMAQFQSALDACVQSWSTGNSIVLLQSNIQELFGHMLLQYFKQSLAQQVGQPLAFTFSSNSNGGQTVVHMPEHKPTQLSYQPIFSIQKSTVRPVSAGSRKMQTGIKKAPRPMNCWIIFRDAMHKQLKAESPHLTVQQICKSSICALLTVHVG